MEAQDSSGNDAGPMDSMERASNHGRTGAHPSDEVASMTIEILVVDDDPIQGTTRKAILSAMGWKTAVTQSPLEAVSMLERPEFRAGLRVLITDHVMPQLPGPELVRKARLLAPDLPILVISGDPEAGLAYRETGVRFQMKPVHPEILSQLVRSMFGAETEGILRTA